MSSTPVFVSRRQCLSLIREITLASSLLFAVACGGGSGDSSGAGSGGGAGGGASSDGEVSDQPGEADGGGGSGSIEPGIGTGAGQGNGSGGNPDTGPCAGAPDDVLCDERDGRRYPLTTIGEQVWMAENLAYDPGSGVACPDQKSELCDDYGLLYDWSTALNEETPKTEGSGPRGICPKGSHLPTDSEWESLALTVVALLDEGELVNTDDYANLAPAFMATSGWEADDGSKPTNLTGFSALPGGQIDQFGKSFGVGSRAWWWSSTQAQEAQSPQGYTRNVWNKFDTFWRIYTPEAAFLSVRCVLD